MFVYVSSVEAAVDFGSDRDRFTRKRDEVVKGVLVW